MYCRSSLSLVLSLSVKLLQSSNYCFCGMHFCPSRFTKCFGSIREETNQPEIHVTDAANAGGVLINILQLQEEQGILQQMARPPHSQNRNVVESVCDYMQRLKQMKQPQSTNNHSSPSATQKWSVAVQNNINDYRVIFCGKIKNSRQRYWMHSGEC